MSSNEIKVERDRNCISVYCNDKFIGAIENTSASCDVIDLLIKEIDTLKLYATANKAL